MKKKIGFVYFEQIYHIHHFIGIANELSKQSDTIVDILTYKNEHIYLFKLLNLLNSKNINVIQLNTRIDRIIIEKIKRRTIPSTLFLHKKNKKRLLKYDALVFTDYNTSYLLKKKRQNEFPKFIFTFHGAGDGAYTFQETVKEFDFLLINGKNFYNRLSEKKLLQNNENKIVGYSKFDITKIESKNKQLFDNKNITVVYNPHFKQELSSWYKEGLKILEFFYKHKEYNLIFAPHLKLFNEKGKKENPDIDKKYYQAENIVIDVDSINLVNMTYTLNADVYLGDVSSQVYEFLIKPRPCIFINSHNVDWKDDDSYNHWKLGQVIKNTDNFKEVLKLAFENQTKYEDIQKELFEYNYDIQKDKTSSLRAAEAIIELLEN